MTGYALSAERARTNLRKRIRTDATMIENLSKEQLQGILEAIPAEISFVDENDLVRFWNKRETRIFRRPVSALGKSVQNCHPSQSVGKVNQILSDFKSGRRDSAEFWINLGEKKVYLGILLCGIKQASI